METSPRVWSSTCLTTMPIVLLLVLLVPRLHCQKCGNISKDLQLQLPQGEDRIMMGRTASLHAVPWQAFILRWNRRTIGKTWLGHLEDITYMFRNRLEGTKNDQSLCGGSVIAKRFVLTACHCLDMERKLKVDDIYIRVLSKPRCSAVIANTSASERISTKS